jgi:hypothetical protein
MPQLPEQALEPLMRVISSVAVICNMKYKQRFNYIIIEPPHTRTRTRMRLAAASNSVMTVYHQKS